MLDQPHQSLLVATRLFVPSFYGKTAGLPSDLTDGEVFNHFLAYGETSGMSPSPLFDAETALAEGREAGLPQPRSGETALAWWLRVGLPARVVPTPLFDAAFYERNYPDVVQAGLFSFRHFVEIGLVELRRPYLGFDPDWVAQQLAPSRSGLPPLLRFLLEPHAAVSPTATLRLMDWPADDSEALWAACVLVRRATARLAEQMSDHEADRLLSLFVPAYYVREAGLPAGTSDAAALLHFAEHGLQAGMTGSPLFDAAHYRAQAAAAGLAEIGERPAVLHWLQLGIAAEIVPTPYFDAAFYLSANRDVAQVGTFGFLHFVDHGVFEERRANGWLEAPLLAYLLRATGTRVPPSALIAELLQFAPEWTWDVATLATTHAVLKARYMALCAKVPGWAISLLFALFEPGYYARRAGLAEGTAEISAFAHFLDVGMAGDIDPCPLFDCALYRTRVAARPDCTPVGADGAVVHFLREGVLKRVIATERFDEGFYLWKHPDIDPAHVFSYEHFLRHGLREGKPPNAWYDRMFCDARVRGGVGLPGYYRLLMHGLDEGVVPNGLLAGLLGCDVAPEPIPLATFDALLSAAHLWDDALGHAGIERALLVFVPEAYDGRGELPASASVWDRLIHFLRIGLARGDDVGPLFDAGFYLQAAGVPANPGMPALRHFLQFGFADRVIPTPVFDVAAYLRFNPELKDWPGWIFEHFIRHGVRETRAFSTRPAINIAAPPGALAAPAARVRLLIAAGRVPVNVDAAERGRISGLIESQTLLRAVVASDNLAGIMAQAQRWDPGVGDVADVGEFMMPPFFNPLAEPHRAIRARLPRARYDSIVCVPWIRTGGSDLLSGLFIQALCRVRPGEHVLLLRTDNPHYERPEWIPDGIDVVDISDVLKTVNDKFAELLLYTVFLGVAPTRVFNINSRLAWQCFRRFGKRLAESMQLYGHLFCWDQTKSGRRVGYPTDFYAETAPFLTGLMTDNQYLVDELVRMYQAPAELAARMMPLNTPTRVEAPTPTMAERSLATARRRPLVLWGGRLDFQKRFDIVAEVARLMPQIDFACWGLPVLDDPPDLTSLPANLRLNGPFQTPTELPLDGCDGWLFTSAWEGMPNMLIELATLGMPIVASAVGAVPYLIDATTGWPVDPEAGVGAYVAAVAEMVGRPALRIAKAKAAQARAVEMFSVAQYDRALAGYLERVPVEIAA